MSNVINNDDIMVKVSGKIGPVYSRTNIIIGATHKFIYKEVSEGKNSITKIFPQTRIDSYGIEVSQSRLWLIFGIIFSVILPIILYIYFSDYTISSLSLIFGLVFLFIWAKSKKLVFEINTISKDKLEIELKSTNTKDIESLMQFLNNNI